MKSCVVITGASKGIGRAIAQQLALDPNQMLLLIGRDATDLQKLCAELPCPSHYFICDFNESQQVTELIAKIRSFVSQGYLLKGILNNAGIFKPQKSEEQRLDLWTTQFQVNLFSAVQLTEGLIDLLKLASPSWILNIASTLGSKASAGVGAYGASKAAMIHWTQTLAIELGNSGVRANVISPGIVDTPLHGFHHLATDEKEKKVQQMGSLQPLGRIGNPSDIAQAAAYLCSPGASWVTGAVLNIDGGINLL